MPQWTIRDFRRHAAGIAGFLAVILASGMRVLVFGPMVMRPMWYGPFTSIYFMPSAAPCGAAAIVVTTYMVYGFDRDAIPQSLRAPASSHELPMVIATPIGIAAVASMPPYTSFTRLAARASVVTELR